MRRTSIATICLSLLLSASYARADDAQLDKLIKDLGNADSKVCIEALDALGELGGDAAGAVSALTDAIDHKDGEVCWRACKTLGAIGAVGQLWV